MREAQAKSNRLMHQPAPARYLLIFVTVQIVLFTLVLLEPVHRAVVVPITEALAAISAFLMTTFDASVLAQGMLIRNAQTGFAVEIASGCNGVEPTIMLVAAMLAFPAAARDKIIGIGIGALTIQALNTIRVISLFYLGQWNAALFDWAHLYLWPAMILIDALVVWLLWVRYLQRRRIAAR